MGKSEMRKHGCYSRKPQNTTEPSIITKEMVKTVLEGVRVVHYDGWVVGPNKKCVSGNRCKLLDRVGTKVFCLCFFLEKNNLTHFEMHFVLRNALNYIFLQT